MSAHRCGLSRRYRAALRAYVDTTFMQNYQRLIVDNSSTNPTELTRTVAARCALERTRKHHFCSGMLRHQSAHTLAAVIVSSTRWCGNLFRTFTCSKAHLFIELTHSCTEILIETFLHSAEITVFKSGLFFEIVIELRIAQKT